MSDEPDDQRSDEPLARVRVVGRMPAGGPEPPVEAGAHEVIAPLRADFELCVESA